MVYDMTPARGNQRNDPRRHAEDVLARARARDRRVITPGTAASPADSSATVVIPRYRVTVADPHCPDPHCPDPDSTQNLRAATARGDRF